MRDYKQEIRTFIVNNFLFGQGNNLADNTSFLDQGIIDSTGVLELATHIESAYGIQVKDEELVPENLDSINAISSFLEKKAAAKPA
jgi:acyl carrier protein